MAFSEHLPMALSERLLMALSERLPMAPPRCEMALGSLTDLWRTDARSWRACRSVQLDLVTQAGTYVKEFCHGDFGRTVPSVGSLLGCSADILQLDVLDLQDEHHE